MLANTNLQVFFNLHKYISTKLSTGHTFNIKFSKTENFSFLIIKIVVSLKHPTIHLKSLRLHLLYILNQ